MGNERKKKEAKITKKMYKKLAVTFFIIVGLLVVLFARIIYINQVDGANYSKKVLSQHTYTDTTLAFKRGSILDANGNLLAVSEEIYNVVIDCYVINHQKEENQKAVKDAIIGVAEITEDEVTKALTETPDKRYCVLRKGVAYSDIKSLEEKLSDPKTVINGLWLEKNYKRYYPQGTMASSLIGFANSSNAGMCGLESEYDETLNGSNGRMFGYLNEDNNFETDVINPEDGNSIVTTINMNVQKVVDQKILEFNQEYANNAYDDDGSKNTGVIVMNPKTGEIIAMADYPNFDLNNPRSLDGFIGEEQLAALTDEQKIEELNKLWNNYCISSTYEPGSTAKLMTVAAGLETGKLKGEESFMCDGSETYNGSTIHCSHREGHGQENLEDSIADSCNDALMQIGNIIGPDTMVEYQKIFNFGYKTTIDLPGEASTASLLFDPANMKPVDTAVCSFGQGFNTTMIQMAAAYCSMINGGNYIRPHCVSRVLNSTGETVKHVEPTVIKQTVSKSTCDSLMQYMKAAVDRGTAKTSKVEGYSMGGKTGTAQKLPRIDERYVVSFAGYVPANNPEVMIYVVIDEPNIEPQDKAILATTLGKNILTEILPMLNIYPDEQAE